MEYKLEILRSYGDSHYNCQTSAKMLFQTYYFSIIFAASKRAKHTVLIITARILIPE